MEIISTNVAQLKYKGKGGDYSLLLPIGSEIQEAFEVVSCFYSAVNKLHQDYLEQLKTKDLSSEGESGEKDGITE
jgi:hypothetical protein